ncbi:CCR4-NOT transcription complex subunit 10 [Orchesella cincta]|uniref:CCR4-NOT transcription complex subunit 10 n=1 Tax=Orchesella cincta TaxID=48709 RepID=A0A1D2NC85_ORCCI|nr:CCR4-NOT transcription complex subunit 10 [Orchesella cincta]
MSYDEQSEFLPLSETEREVCEAAINHFSEEDFHTSADLLANVVANRPNDHRFKHNLAVAEFRQRNCKDWKKFSEELTKAFSDARLEQEPDLIKQDNLQYPVLWYNLAVVYFHQRRTRKALAVLEKLSKTFSNVMTPLTKRTKLLLIDVLIRVQQYERGLNEIEVFEAQLRPSSVDISSAPKIAQGPTAVSQPATTQVADSKFDAEVRIKLQQYKTLCHLCMKSLKLGKKECRQLFMATGPSSPITYVGTCLKAYHDYLRGNVKKAHKTITNLKQPGTENAESHENILEKYGDLLNVVCLNNEACCDFYLGKPTIAGMNFVKAATEFDKYSEKDNSTLPLYAAKINMKLELMYNFGVTLLNLRRPAEALKYLNMCLNFYFNNPRLWLRVAECCIQIQKLGNEHLTVGDGRRNLIKDHNGSETSGKIVFADSFNEYKPTNNEDAVKENDKEKPTLEYANICLENALRLVESDSIANEGCLYVKPSTPISSIQEINSLHAAILCAAAYVQLKLENYPLAIKRCHQLMSLHNIPGAYQYLAKMYLGEAYFKYGQLTKAHEALFQENSCDVNFYVSPESEDKKDDTGSECSWPGQPSAGTNGTVNVKPVSEWNPNDEISAKAILVYNQAVKLASSGELDKASEHLRQWISKNEGRALAPEFMKLAIYLHIRLGNIAKAKSLLKTSAGNGRLQ